MSVIAIPIPHPVDVTNNHKSDQNVVPLVVTLWISYSCQFVTTVKSLWSIFELPIIWRLQNFATLNLLQNWRYRQQSNSFSTSHNGNVSSKSCIWVRVVSHFATYRSLCYADNCLCQSSDFLSMDCLTNIAITI